MKLIYLSNVRIPTEKAHGLQIMKMCEAFALHRLKVELLAPRRFNPTKGNPFEYYDVKKNVRITKLPCLDFLPLDFILGKVAFLIQTISFLISAKIYLLFKKYDILYTREQFVGLFFRNFILEIHSLSHKIRFFHKKSWQRAKKIIVLTSFIKNQLIKIGIPENKILIASDGVDLEKFAIKISKEEARKKIGLPSDKKIILYSGSFYLYRWKGIDVLLEAAKTFNNDYLFVLVGGNKKEIKSIKNDYKLKNLLLIGHKPHKAIPLYLKAADVLILPNKKGDKISEEYTSPLKLFEYMASKRPIIASDLASIREILNKKNAILIEAGDPEALEKGIKFALGNSDFCAKITEQEYKDVRKYAWDKRAEKILKFAIEA